MWYCEELFFCEETNNFECFLAENSFLQMALHIFEKVKIRKLKRIIRYLFLLINMVFVLVLAASYLTPCINPEKFWPSSFLGLTYIYVLVVNVVFVVLWLIFYWRYLFFSLVCILMGISTHKTVINISPEKRSEEEGIKLLSYNVRYFYAFYGENKKETSVFDFIAAQDADIICLQESRVNKNGKFSPINMKAVFPDIVSCQLAHQYSNGGPVTFSRFPIVSMGEIRFANTNNMVIYSDIEKEKGDTIRVYNCHLQSNRIRPEDYSIIDTLGLENKKLQEAKQIGIKLKNAYGQRSEQIEKLRLHIKECRYPVIVCGDFNDTPVSYTYHEIASELNDSFVEAGHGISATYRGKLPPFRIDYIFYDDDFNAYNYEKFLVDYSDHFPITATLKRIK